MAKIDLLLWQKRRNKCATLFFDSLCRTAVIGLLCHTTLLEMRFIIKSIIIYRMNVFC
ncbi:hypothetical protein HMPREF1569_4473 [Klebsiella oxytoca OK-1]|nr:hypothetical protein HMPREF1569_4473 [Klebsiella oxytoca OK-1]